MVTQPVKIAKITDGTSKTMVVSEKYVRSDNYEAGPARNSDDRGWTDGWDADQMRSRALLPIRDSDPIGWEPGLEQIFRRQFSGCPIWCLQRLSIRFAPHRRNQRRDLPTARYTAVSFDVDVTIFNSWALRNGMALNETNDLTGIN